MNYGIQEVFMNEVLMNYFSGRSSDIWLGLGLSYEGANTNLDDFIEPEAGTGYSKQPFVCSAASGGVCYNANEIAFDIATKDWTTNGRVIDKVGIFKRTLTTSVENEPTETFTLWCVLPLNPVETVVAGDTVIINANAIRLQLTNKGA